MRPSRRAFFLAGRLAEGPWDRFVAALNRRAPGRVHVLRAPAEGQGGRVQLQAAKADDALHALALCGDLDAALTLEAWGDAGIPASRHAVLVNIDKLDRWQALPDGSWRAEPGVTLATCRQYLPGLGAGLAPETRLAHWLLGPEAPGPEQVGWWQAAEITLADGSWERLGPFGASTTTAPLSPAASQRTSSLFRLVGEPQTTQWRSLPSWPAQYRLDALFAETPNLAHLLLGSRCTLAWTDSFVLAPAAPAPESVRQHVPGRSPWARALEQRVKMAFDPPGRFPEPPGATV